MKGLEALKIICEKCYINSTYSMVCYDHGKCKSYKTIERELKVNQILKEKNIDLKTLRANLHLDIDFLAKWFKVELEEMTLIVEWLKEGKNEDI